MRWDLRGRPLPHAGPLMGAGAVLIGVGARGAERVAAIVVGVLVLALCGALTARRRGWWR